MEEAKVKLPEALKAAETAKPAHDKTLSATWQAMDALGIDSFLSSDALDTKLVQYIIIKEATPTGLADFAQQSAENQKLIDQLFADKDLMLQMLLNDGPEKGKYGQAMKIYTGIQKASPKAKDGVYQRLAMATCLAHAVPIERREQGGVRPATEPKLYLDPVQRYLSFEKWYEAGELHKGFKDLNVWNLRRVVDCADPDEMFAWGRRMLQTLRPDCIPSDDDSLVFAAVQQFVASRRLLVPVDVSLACTDPSPNFEWQPPPVTHIRWDYQPVIRRILRWADNVAHGKNDRRQTQTKAEIVMGGTIEPAPGKG